MVLRDPQMYINYYKVYHNAILHGTLNVTDRGVARNLLRRGTNQRVWGTEVPQRGPGTEPTRFRIGFVGIWKPHQRGCDKKIDLR